MSVNYAILFSSGLISLLGQIVLLRELNVAFHGVELIYPLAIGEWMLVVAIGTRFWKPAESRNQTATLFIFLAIFLVSGIGFIRGIGLFLSSPVVAVATFLVPVAPTAYLSGLLFVESSSSYRHRNRRIAGAYGTEALGGLAGALFAGIGFHYGLSNLFVAFLCVLLSAIAAGLAFQGKNAGVGRIIAVTLALVTLVCIYRVSLIDMRMTGWGHPGLFFADDFRCARIAATYRNTNVSVFANNQLIFASQDPRGARVAHLAALQHPEPRRILMIGSGWDGSVRELLLYKPLRIDVILPEEDPYIRFRLARDVRKSLADSTVHLSMSDPRRFLRHKGLAWDLIVINISENLSCPANRFYTREFFASVADHLYPGGIVVVRLPGERTLQTTPEIIQAASICRALSSIFPEQIIVPGTPTLVASSFAPLTLSPGLLIERLRERGIESNYISPVSLQELFSNTSLTTTKDRIKNSAAPENSDSAPVCYAASVLSWAAYLAPESILARGYPPAKMKKTLVPAGLIICVFVILLFAVSRLQYNWRRDVLAAAGGYLGILSESVLILSYQAKEGALYQHLPFFLAMFMGGLSFGAPLFRDLTVQISPPKNTKRLWGAGILIAFMLLNTTTIGYANGSQDNPILPLFLTAAAGFLTGGLFSCSGLYSARKPQKVLSSYTADLIGGAIGALSAGFIFIPLFGLAATSMGIIILAFFALILI